MGVLYLHSLDPGSPLRVHFYTKNHEESINVYPLKRAGLEHCWDQWYYPLAHLSALVTIHLIRSGVDIRRVQLLLGHSNLNATQAYLQFKTKTCERCIIKSNFNAVHVYYDILYDEGIDPLLTLLIY